MVTLAHMLGLFELLNGVSEIRSPICYKTLDECLMDLKFAIWTKWSN